MKFNELDKRPTLYQDYWLSKGYDKFEDLLEALTKMEIPSTIVNTVNQHIDAINFFSGSDRELVKEMKRSRSRILVILEKEFSIVTRNHYRRIWLAIGMAAIGLPVGIVFGAGFGNMSLLVVGLPVGLIIGIVVGGSLDKKAFENGKQLDIAFK